MVPFVNFSYIVGPSINLRGTFRQLSVHLRDLHSTFRESTGPSVNLCQLSVHTWDLT